MAALLVSVIYLAFMSLGLPDSLLGSGWPSMHIVFDVPESYAGYVSMTIALMTIISSLLSPSIIKKIKTEYIVISSIALTVAGLLGFSFATKYWMLFLIAVPYGLGAGSIDAALNHYVANHYSSKVMNFLHCFYGLGAIVSPVIMGLALKYAHWNQGYQWTAYIQIFILIVCVFSLPLWKINQKEGIEEHIESKSIKDAIKMPAVLLTLVAFFAYCAGEVTCFLWVPTYFDNRYVELSKDVVAAFGALIFGGLMIGRLIAGFISDKVSDKNLIRAGAIVELIGIILIALPINSYILTAIAFVIVGTGMGPIYPAIQHMAPTNFGKEYSAPVIGLQMASAYIGATFMPTVFGLLFENIGFWIMPIYLGFFLTINISLLEISYKVNKLKAKEDTI